MPVNYDILASIVDIRVDLPKPTDTFLIDTNVWYWFTYSRASLGNMPPKAHQRTQYPTFLNKVIAAKAGIYRSEFSLPELTHIIEKTEFEIYQKSNSIKSSKEFRHNLPVERENVIEEVKLVWNQVKSMAKPLEIMINEAAGDAALLRFCTQPLDGYDLFLLESLRTTSCIKVITDDGGFSTVPGITIFTANTNVIDLAKKSGKLINR